MKKRIKEYDGEGIRVIYDIPRCIHVARCVERLPQVFDKDRRPWIDPNLEPADTVADICLQCPTGALKFERLDGGVPEPVPSENVVTLDADGPAYVSGDIEVTDAAGDVVLRDTRVAFCRCGASDNKPLCDGKHDDAGFTDDGSNSGPVRDEPSDPGRLEVTVLKDGPLRLVGPFRIVDAAGNTTPTMTKGALCRCGASNMKPFCDGSHIAAGFQAD